MAYETGTATNYLDMINKFRRFITGCGTSGTPGYTGTGNGTLDNFEAKPAAVTETWTLTCTTGGGPGVGVFSVTGSVSGAQASATVGQFYENSFIEFVINDGTTDFVVSDQFTVAVTEGALTTASQEWALNRWNPPVDFTFPGGGNFSAPVNAIDSDVSTRIERAGATTGIWEVYFAHAVDVKTYTLIPVNDSGASTDSPSAWTLEYSDDGGVTWTVEDTQAAIGSWIAATGKTFVIASPSGRHLAWRLNFTNNNGGADISLSGIEFVRTGETLDYLQYPGEISLQGPGLTGSDSIFVAMLPVRNTGAPYFNFQIFGMKSFDSTVRPSAQAGASPAVIMPHDDGANTYWFVGNGRRFVIESKIGTAYVGTYCGFILPYGLPVEYPYPLLVAANDTNVDRKFSDTNIAQYRGFFDPGNDAAYLCNPGGNWIIFENYLGTGSSESNSRTRNFSPYQTIEGTLSALYINFRDGAGGEQPLYPIELQERSPSAGSPTDLNNYGELDGCYAVSGFNVNPEDTFTVSADTYMAFPNVNRLDRNDFMALRLV